MPGFSRPETAARAGVDVAYIEQLVEAGLLTQPEDGLTIGDVRRIGLIRSMQEAGLPLDGLAAGLNQGVFSLDFVDTPEYDRFSGLGAETFQAVSDRTGIPVPLLTKIREAIGLGAAHPQDRLREDELAVVPFVEAQLRFGFRPPAIERLLRSMGDNLRRIAESEAEWWLSEVIIPRMEAGLDPSAVEISSDVVQTSERAHLAIFRAIQAQTWTANIITSVEQGLEKAGLYQVPDRPPAICFLDITGFTRLTQERGDQAAAQLAEELARIVKRTSIDHGGRPIKWLGDGVMMYFRDPGPGVVAALDMLDALLAAGLPPAHIGLHAGPVIVQEGDYYGQTVNMAARIAEYARPGEVLVSQAVFDAVGVEQAGADGAMAAIVFTGIGAVDLKGVSGAVGLHAARRAN